jgi:hypothetical protein
MREVGGYGLFVGENITQPSSRIYFGTSQDSSPHDVHLASEVLKQVQHDRIIIITPPAPAGSNNGNCPNPK